SGPPGAWMTLSSDWKTAPVSLRIDALPAHCRLDGRDVDLLHRHHRFERALRHRFDRVRCGRKQGARRDLPRESPLVFAPAAHAFLAAVAGDRDPVPICLL